MMDHPKSGLPDFGRFRCASRINSTCVVKPAGDARGCAMLNQADRNAQSHLPISDRAALERVCSQANADLSSTTNAAVQRATVLMQTPKIWAAVLAVAALVDGRLRTPGADIVRVALAAMEEAEG
jgi:hypothetical protein